MSKKDDDGQQLDDIMREESARGRNTPKRASTLAQERRMREFVGLISNGSCTDADIANAIIALGQQEGSPEFRRLWNIWCQFRGRKSG